MSIAKTFNVRKLFLNANRTMDVSVVFLIVGIVLGITTLIGILGNFCVCLVVFWNRSKRNQMNILLVNLAVSDIGMCASCMPFAVATVLLNIQVRAFW